MRLVRTLVATAAAGTLVALPVASATAVDAPLTPKPRFAVTGLHVIGSKATYDVTSAAAVVRFRVQVKDFDKKFDPRTVKVRVSEKVAGTSADTFVVTPRLVGKSKVVSNWLGTISVPAGSAAATYCISLVNVDDSTSLTGSVTALAKGLKGRDCFSVVNTTPVVVPAPVVPAA